MLNNVLFIFSSIYYSLIMAHNYSETCLIHHVSPYFLYYICFILSMMLISKLIFPDNSDLELRK